MEDEKRNGSALLRVPYDNYQMYHPDGELMCFCSQRKANWYVERGLAEFGEDNKIYLTFRPNGYGDPTIILDGRENKCVITSSDENLTKHHVIPSQYRKHFDLQYKDKNSIDLVVLNRDAHDIYELHANDFKKQLYDDFVINNNDSIINLQNEKHMAWLETHKLYKTLNTHKEKLPVEKQIFMQMRIEGNIEKWGFNEEDLNGKYTNFNFSAVDASKIIVDRVGTLNLIVLWKLHFIKFGKPQHMPTWWKPNLIKVINKYNPKPNKSELVEIDMFDTTLLELIIKYDLYETAKLYF